MKFVALPAARCKYYRQERVQRHHGRYYNERLHPMQRHNSLFPTISMSRPAPTTHLHDDVMEWRA